MTGKPLPAAFAEFDRMEPTNIVESRTTAMIIRIAKSSV